jgi:hypothetical protein
MAKKRTNVADQREAQRQRIETIPTANGDAANLRAHYLEIAIIAAIPPDNVDAYLEELVDHLFTFNLELDDDRSRHLLGSIAIDELATAARKMISAIDKVQKTNKNLKAQQTTHFVRYLPGLGRGSYEELQDSLKKFLRNYEFGFSKAKLPKKRGGSRTQILLKNIWLTTRKFGGDLTYDKHSERGTLTEVIKYLQQHFALHADPEVDDPKPRIGTDLSPSQLDRLRPRR